MELSQETYLNLDICVDDISEALYFYFKYILNNNIYMSLNYIKLIETIIISSLIII